MTLERAKIGAVGLGGVVFGVSLPVLHHLGAPQASGTPAQIKVLEPRSQCNPSTPTDLPVPERHHSSVSRSDPPASTDLERAELQARLAWWEGRPRSWASTPDWPMSISPESIEKGAWRAHAWMAPVAVDAIDCEEPPCLVFFDLSEADFSQEDALYRISELIQDALERAEMPTGDCLLLTAPVIVCAYSPEGFPGLVDDQRTIARMNRWLWSYGYDPYLFHEAFQ